MLNFNLIKKSKIYDTGTTYNNDILNNLKYAVGIQETLLPNEKKLELMNPESFIIYQPKSFVSGDFYWMEKRESKLYIILGDSTGHGISASFISLIAMSAIESLKSYPDIFDDPKGVLEYLNNHLYCILKKDRGSKVSESAEMAAVVIDFKTNILSYASAGINLFTCRNYSICKLNKNKTSVGESSKELFNINSFSHELSPGEKIFLISDGLKDQFGGVNGKKIGTKKILELISVTSHLHAWQQKESILNYLSDWKKNTEQTDDISLISIKIPYQQNNYGSN